MKLHDCIPDDVLGRVVGGHRLEPRPLAEHLRSTTLLVFLRHFG